MKLTPTTPFTRKLPPEIEGHPMRDQFSNTQAIRKPAVTSKGGIVAAQSSRAAQVGAEVLAAGGDCVDAVIATTFALGVLEPWMSGLGGGGAASDIFPWPRVKDD